MDEAINAGALVTVTDGTRQLEGIVFEIPSRTKAVVAVIDRARGPLFRTVDPTTLTLRDAAAPADRALQLLIRRTPHPGRDGGGGRAGPGRGASGGHTRPPTHRPTGR